MNGRLLAYSWQDDLSNEEADLAAAIRLTAADDVFGVLETSSASGGAAEYLEQPAGSCGGNWDGPGLGAVPQHVHLDHLGVASGAERVGRVRR